MDRALQPAGLELVTQTIGLAQLVAQADAIIAGQVRGRTVVDVRRSA